MSELKQALADKESYRTKLHNAIRKGKTIEERLKSTEAERSSLQTQVAEMQTQLAGSQQVY